jgi:hypothetical protein
MVYQMSVKYKVYAPDQGFEEGQAKIFNDANNRTITAQEIKARFEQENIDPNTVRYAFSEDGTLLAYIQARDYPQLGEVHIGIPWAISECPLNVQEKLFDDLFDYMMERKSDLKLKINVLNEEKYLHFVKRKDFKRENEYLAFDLDATEGIDIDISKLGYSIREGTDADYKMMIDSFLINFLNGDEKQRPQAETYINNFKQQELFYLALNDGTLVGSIGLSKPNEEIGVLQNQFFRFAPMFTIPDFEDSIIPLIKQTSEYVIKNNWKIQIMRVNLRETDFPDIKAIRSIPHKEVTIAIKFGL